MEKLNGCVSPVKGFGPKWTVVGQSGPSEALTWTARVNESQRPFISFEEFR